MLQDRYTTDIQGETRSKLDFLVAGFGCQTGCMQSRYNSHSKEATNCGCCEKRRQDRIEQDRTEEIAGDANGMGVYLLQAVSTPERQSDAHKQLVQFPTTPLKFRQPNESGTH